MKLRHSSAAALALGLAAALACSGDPASPEERVRAVLAELEAAAEARDAPALRQHLSEEYFDAGGRDRRAAASLAAFYFLRNERIHLLTRVRRVEFPAPDEARAEALVAMAGSPLPGPEAFLALRADLYRFEIELREEDGTWRVTGGDWSPARIDDWRGP